MHLRCDQTTIHFESTTVKVKKPKPENENIIFQKK